MPDVNDEGFQRQMVQAFLEKYPESTEMPAAQVSRETGVNSDSILRWWDPERGPSFPLREPLKSDVYVWYKKEVLGEMAPSPGPTPDDGRPWYLIGEPVDTGARLKEIIQGTGTELDKSELMVDLALALRADALRQREIRATIEAQAYLRQEEAAARRQGELGARRSATREDPETKLSGSRKEGFNRATGSSGSGPGGPGSGKGS